MEIYRKIELRQEANELLSQIVSHICNNYKELRFNQLLCILEIISYKNAVDNFYEEPIDTLKRCYTSIFVILDRLNAIDLIHKLDKLVSNE